MEATALLCGKCAGGGFPGFGVAGALATLGCSMESLAEVHGGNEVGRYREAKPQALDRSAKTELGVWLLRLVVGWGVVLRFLLLLHEL